MFISLCFDRLGQYVVYSTFCSCRNEDLEEPVYGDAANSEEPQIHVGFLWVVVLFFLPVNSAGIAH